MLHRRLRQAQQPGRSREQTQVPKRGSDQTRQSTEAEKPHSNESRLQGSSFQSHIHRGSDFNTSDWEDAQQHLHSVWGEDICCVYFLQIEILPPRGKGSLQGSGSSDSDKSHRTSKSYKSNKLQWSVKCQPHTHQYENEAEQCPSVTLHYESTHRQTSGVHWLTRSSTTEFQGQLEILA